MLAQCPDWLHDSPNARFFTLTPDGSTEAILFGRLIAQRENLADRLGDRRNTFKVLRRPVRLTMMAMNLNANSHVHGNRTACG